MTTASSTKNELNKEYGAIGNTHECESEGVDDTIKSNNEYHSSGIKRILTDERESKRFKAEATMNNGKTNGEQERPCPDIDENSKIALAPKTKPIEIADKRIAIVASTREVGAETNGSAAKTEESLDLTLENGDSDRDSVKYKTNVAPKATTTEILDKRPVFVDWPFSDLDSKGNASTEFEDDDSELEARSDSESSATSSHLAFIDDDGFEQIDDDAEYTE